VAKAEADGYTILHDATAFSVNTELYPKLPFDYRKDFEPVFLVSLVPNILVVTPSVPVNTLAELIALAKSRPGEINFASAGNGTGQHLSMELFKLMTGTNLKHVPYRGAAAAYTDVISGRTPVFWSASQ